ncbi:nucleoside diphosphate-linked moiety X motif 17 [Siniperca chuatsi]|uniref:nucleoside diphosphate-linked moiety X motif 17 n=1 Tax=Siniperca chuatsi TaxID=119488 RepID=UPI001CE1CA77|nr:nucleoside diphosphate-linked moiety X motif 17 [Siniperca chuatsi]XP_044062760.1 nucleoside diphosphate-linked moiety X motif 17 [Siniperca chuatsi]XP_044062761.1 nucleoside diphosphate-linked moiety X motif 17 [Siniperca chuatsi]XP_044062762.1 nucleoside diphosphate-linked moiety X motif 17 [Siniperca chuatsi]XP_044062763.1 nucleoside diphosphate-linked moiety X motif 17 [Siniperca chuatsi]XP_044062764.1 nucleoside diphosphate-linked moiety X motif 17 [Siniperca chuatsi]XP_044062765.1 nu
MDKVRRILVHVCKERAAPQRARFVQSVTGHFSDCGADQVEVNCSLEKNQLILYRGDKGRGIPLKRPAFCPIKHLSVTEAAAIPLDVQQRGIDVGVAIILQTANQRVLLTRRAKELRIFPNVWVPPGGHLEPDETLLDAGLRELMEETGLKLEQEEVSPEILGLWESVYPPMLSRGLPQRHHIVIYMLLHSSLSHLQLQASLSPSPAEVSACLWADSRLVRAIVSSADGEDAEVRVDGLPSSISVSQVSTDGALSDSTLPLTVFVSQAPVSGPDVERVSTGTKFALELWLRSLEASDL